MSIKISFTMEAKKSLIPGIGWNQQKAEQFARNLADEFGYHCSVTENCIIFQFCPEGYLWMTWEKPRLAGECQTNLAGPGFHASVIYFLELFAARGDLKLSVDDETGFYENRDFYKMRHDYFYPWFSSLLEHILEYRDEESQVQQLICWPPDYYLPEHQKDTVVTHIRRFEMSEIYGMSHSGLASAFARDFFIWNEEEKDAYYYRNCGLVLMNQECCFMPSKRSLTDRKMNQEIIRLLERAVSMDREIPFPQQEYLELCGLAKRSRWTFQEQRTVTAACGMPEGLVYHTIGCLRFAVPGSFLYDGHPGSLERYHDGLEKHWHEYYICALQGDGDVCFQEALFQKDIVTRIVEIQLGAARGKMAVCRPTQRDGKTVHRISAQIIYKEQMTIINVCFDDPGDQEWAMDLIRKIQVVEEKEEEQK
ncbi:MAG: hypothetical protein ACLTKI_03470 [Lachnospiraceae bacterium]